MVRRSLLRLGLVAAGLYLAYAVIAFVVQRELLFAGRRRGPKRPAVTPGEGVQSVWLSTPGGRVEAYYMPARETGQPAPALLFAHGNAELIEQWPASLEPLRAHGFALLLVEYPGYGRSDGRPSEESVRDAMLAGYDFLAARPEVDRARIIGIGRSLGGGAIGTVAGRRPLAALVLSSTFTSVRPFAAGMLVPSLLVRDPFDTLAAVQRFEGPVLVVHGTRDLTIPYAHGRKLAAAAKHGKLISYDAGHNDCPPDWDELARELVAFLREQGVLR